MALSQLIEIQVWYGPEVIKFQGRAESEPTSPKMRVE